MRYYAVGNEPYLLYKLASRNLTERLEQERVMDCMGVAHRYGCPANLPLLDYVRLGKAEVGKMIRGSKEITIKN